MSAEEALRRGLITKIVRREELLSCAEEVSQRMMSRPTTSVRAVKQALRRGIDLNLETGLETERHIYAPRFRLGGSQT
jgi:enoyl-CoA hydratase/carnithine racemase